MVRSTTNVSVVAVVVREHARLKQRDIRYGGSMAMTTNERLHLRLMAALDKGQRRLSPHQTGRLYQKPRIGWADAVIAAWWRWCCR